MLQGTWETSKTTSQDHPSRHPQKTARIVPGERRRQDRQADGGGLLVWRCETSADDRAEQGGRGTEHFARVRASRPQAGPVACAEVISNYNYDCVWTYKPQADFCLLSFSTYSKWDENVCFSAKRSLPECCVCNIGILWKNKKSLVFTVTWLICSAQVIVVTARDVQERNWNWIFAYLEVSIHILEWICCVLQISDICTSLKLSGRKWKQLWTLLFVLPVSAGCSCLSCHCCCRTHKYYPRPAAPSWPLGYHEFYSNGSCCDHFSFISLIRREHDKPVQIVWGRKRDGHRISGSQFSFCQLFQFSHFLSTLNGRLWQLRAFQRSQARANMVVSSSVNRVNSWNKTNPNAPFECIGSLFILKLVQCRRSHLNLPLLFFQLPSAHLHWRDMQKKKEPDMHHLYKRLANKPKRCRISSTSHFNGLT